MNHLEFDGHSIKRKDFTAEALGLSEQAGVAGAAKQLGLHESQAYAWRKKARCEASRAVALDPFSRMVAGGATGRCMKAKLDRDGLQMALWRRRMPKGKGAVVQSDRGRQHCSWAYQALLAKHDLICGMSGKGNCHDSAVAKGFFHALNMEMVHGENFPAREAMRRAALEHIEVDFNRTRGHGANGCISPLALANKLFA